MSNHDEQTTENSAGRAPLVSRRTVATLSVGAAGVIVGQSVGLFVTLVDPDTADPDTTSNVRT